MVVDRFELGSEPPFIMFQATFSMALQGDCIDLQNNLRHLSYFPFLFVFCCLHCTVCLICYGVFWWNQAFSLGQTKSISWERGHPMFRPIVTIMCWSDISKLAKLSTDNLLKGWKCLHWPFWYTNQKRKKVIPSPPTLCKPNNLPGWVETIRIVS